LDEPHGGIKSFPELQVGLARIEVGHPLRTETL
jgi:hypothetical protein